jgi:hypothetical protein
VGGDSDLNDLNTFTVILEHHLWLVLRTLEQ